jgi:Lamin Tail Domain/MBG domain (YGX type)/Alpha galactosidase A/NPCBM-associated, NEW3 domain of alpha-galactosidase/Alpha galactosidase C-terminal beta sandwich domain
MPRFRISWLPLVSALALLGTGALAPTASALTPNPLHVGEKPVLGWSSWSTFRHVSTAAIDEAEARAMVSDGLKAEGYQYINQDDGWYECPAVAYTGANQNYGPTVDQWGRWVTSQTTTSDTGAFPDQGTVNGMEVLGNYIHSLGLKFGIYLTPGISGNALAENTPVEANANGHLLGTASGYTADDITLGFTPGLQPAQYPNTLTDAENYNCGGTWELNYNSPGAQLYVDGEADVFASWGVDFVKLDGVLDSNTTDLEAWSKALAQTGRPIALDITEGAYDTAIAPQLDQYATQWEYTPDIEEGGGSTGLTGYQSAYLRLNAAALWQPYAGPGKGFNDLDSVEVGNGQTATNPTNISGVTQRYDGLTLPGRETVLSLWSLASSPLILGSDLTTLNKTQNPVDLALLLNRKVLGVDQDKIPASRIAITPTDQVFAKTERRGDVIVGLFNTDYSQPHVITTSAAKIGLPGGGPYLVRDLWGENSDLCAAQSILTANPTPTSATTPLCAAGTPTSFETAGVISANVPAEGVALYEVTPLRTTPRNNGGYLRRTTRRTDAGYLRQPPPSTTLSLGGISRLTAGQAATATETFTNNGAEATGPVSFSLSAPSGWTVTQESCGFTPSVAPGQVVEATFRVTAPTADTSATVTAAATYGLRFGPSWGRVCQPTGSAAGDPATVTQNVSDAVTVVAAPVVLNEVETGTATTPNQQFVELYNAGASPVDISGWQLQYEGASAPRRGGPTVLATIPQGSSIAAKGYYLIGGAGYVSAGTQPSDNLSFTQTSTTELSSIGGGVGLVDPSGFVVDSVGWGVANNEGFAPSAFQRASNAFVESCPAQANGVVPTVNTPTLTSLISAAPTPASIPPGDSIVRLPDGYDTGSNCNDFSVTADPSPGSTNSVEPHLTITASSPSKFFGWPVPAITPKYSGFVHGDTPASLPIAPTCTTTANRWSPPGRYPTSCSGAADPNYAIDASSYVNGTLTVRGEP